MSIHLQPPVSLVTLVKTEPPTVIKNEPHEEVLEEEISTDIRDIDIVYHPLSEDLIKSETFLEDTLENEHLESVQQQALVVKTENSPFIKTENITQRNKSEDTSDGNVSRDTSQGVVEVQGSHEHSNTLSNLEIHEQLDLNTSKDLNGVGTSSRKAKHAKRTDFVRCYKTDRTTSWEKEKEKIKIIRACDIPIESHEYTSLAKDKYVCNHCQHTYTTLKYLKVHIKRMHREVTTMYQCPYCPYRSKWNVQMHIIQKHKDTKDIQWFQCNLCEKKFKLKSNLTQHMKIHEQMQDLKRQLQPSVPLVTLVKTEPPTVIKNEPPEEALEKEISPDIKDIDIVYHSLSEDLIKNETVSENILETKYLESVETQVLVKTENTSDENVTRGTGQEVIEVQGSYEHCNTLSNLETHEQLVLNSSNEITSWEKEKEKIKIITARDPVESHEYISLVEDEHVCNHCQRAYKGLHSLEYHIRKMHREIMYYQCPYCPYKSKWKNNINQHIIPKHKDTKDIQWFQCNLCEMKFKLKRYLTGHMKVHLRHKQLKDGLDLREKGHHCDKCNFKTDRSTSLKTHKLTHLKPEEIQYFYCYHCSYKAKQKGHLKTHIFIHFKKEQVKFDCYICNFVTPKRESIIKHIKKHSIV